jgi:hypothetical protein
VPPPTNFRWLLTDPDDLSTYRYSTLGFQDAANLDDGDMWPMSYALKKWSPAVERKVVELVKAATS